MKMPKDPSKFSFGATSSTVTSLVNAQGHHFSVF